MSTEILPMSQFDLNDSIPLNFELDYLQKNEALKFFGNFENSLLRLLLSDNTTSPKTIPTRQKFQNDIEGLAKRIPQELNPKFHAAYFGILMKIFPDEHPFLNDVVSLLSSKNLFVNKNLTNKINNLTVLELINQLKQSLNIIDQKPSAMRALFYIKEVMTFMINSKLKHITDMNLNDQLKNIEAMIHNNLDEDDMPFAMNKYDLLRLGQI